MHGVRPTVHLIEDAKDARMHETEVKFLKVVETVKGRVE